MLDADLNLEAHSVGPSNRLISGSGGNFDNLDVKPFMGTFPSNNFLTIDTLAKKLTKFPTLPEIRRFEGP